MPSEYYLAEEIKEEPLDFKDEPVDEFDDMKQEELAIKVPLLDTVSAIKEEPIEFKDDPFDEFDHIKQEEHIDDKCSPSTETSLPLEKTTSLEIPRNNIAETSLVCSECGKKLSCKQTLNNHMLIHTGKKPYSCAYCDMSFRHMTTRHNHIRIVHKIELYSCLTCGEQFDLKTKLNHHLLANK
ncbi:hypothetical protein PMAYCL1PPCAC_01174, partial [Pristionchus mayeri]